MQDLIKRLIDATNAFDVEQALSLFAHDAVIDDLSVGGKFEGIAGIRSYIEQFFVGYSTATKVLSIEVLNERSAIVRLDLTGYFGHETSAMGVILNTHGLIEMIDANVR